MQTSMRERVPIEIKELAQRQAAICKIFSSAQRVLILWLLAEQEKSVSEIAFAIGASLQSISQHLRRMKDRGILESRREGHLVYYRIADNELPRNCLLLANIPQVRWPEVLSE